MATSITGIGPTQFPASTSTSSATNGVLGQDDFLKLLVSQLQNQDPMNPADGTQFLTQLAQFQQLEQSMNMGTDITAIRNDLDTLAGNTASTGTTTGTTATTN